MEDGHTKATNERSKRNGWRHKGVFVVLGVVVLCAACELVGFVTYAATTGRVFRYADLERAREDVRNERLPQLVERPDHGPVPRTQVLHPYLGFVLQPVRGEISSNEYGFLGDPPPIAIGSLDPGVRRADRVVVAVVGGSVAQRMVHSAGEVLARDLRGAACLGGREIEIVNLALAGVKQPQQLLTLQYLLSIGAVIDVLISLDGFNEVALPVAENRAQGVNPFYPRNWSFHVAGLQDIPTMRRIGLVEFWRETRKTLAGVFSAFPLRFSVLANTTWWLVDQAIERHVTLGMLDLSLAQSDGGSRPEGYLRTGPKRAYTDEAQRYRDLVAVWERSTHLLAQASAGAGIASFHFLQPNQRVPESKLFTEDERRVALPRKQLYDEAARKGYPELIAGAARMRAEGLPFDDLTMVYRDVSEAIYVDGCCHVNELGSRILAGEIAKRVRARFEAGAACPRFEPIGVR